MSARVYVVMRYYENSDPWAMRAFETLEQAQGWVDEQPWHSDVGIESYAIGPHGIELESYRSPQIGEWVPR